VKILVPYLLVRDIDASVAFYRDVLGFSVDSTMVGADGKTEHAEVAHGGVRLSGPPLLTVAAAAASTGIERTRTQAHHTIDPQPRTGVPAVVGCSRSPAGTARSRRSTQR